MKLLLLTIVLCEVASHRLIQGTYNRCDDGQFDAISVMDDGYIYAFRGPFAIKMTRFDTYGGSVERIANVFQGVPDFLDAVVTWPKTASSPARTYFFKDEEFWTKIGSNIVGPRLIGKRFIGAPNNADAVFVESTDTIFVKGDLYYRYVRDDKTKDPVHKSKSMWKELPSGLNAVMYNPYTYKTNYFVGLYFYQLNSQNKISATYPRVIREIYLDC